MRTSQTNRRKVATVVGMLGVSGPAVASAILLPAAQGSAQAATAQAAPIAPDTASGMTAFTSDKELTAFMVARAKAVREAEAEWRKKNQPRRQAGNVTYGMGQPVAMPAPPPPPVMAEAAADSAAVSVTASRVTGAGPDNPNITNTQEVGVDEGGIVKVIGNHLVILRRGRLFTVSTAGGTLRSVDHIDAFPPGTTGQGAWYDEMLVRGDRIVVVGYSYARGGTEINRFRMDANGKLRFEDAHHLRSQDYYSSRNYASRLIGDRLVFYTQLPMYGGWREDAMPGVRRWTGSNSGAFKRLAPATQIFVPQPLRDDALAQISVAHSVTDCDLMAATLDCNATVVLGGWSSNFYVARDAVYIWNGGVFDRPYYHPRGASSDPRSIVYRMPLNGSRPGAAQAWGAPTDQFSFQHAADGTLNVAVRTNNRGERMWASEFSGGPLALLKLPRALFGNGAAEPDKAHYVALPLEDDGDGWSFRNRFVGGHLVYAAGGMYNAADFTTAFVVDVAASHPQRAAVTRIAIPHGIDRFDVLGSDAIAIGSNHENALGFSAIRLGGGQRARREDTYLLPDAREGESRSHAFFYRPDADSRDGASGILGLPVSRNLRDARYERLLGSGSAITFLRRNARKFVPAGELEAIAANARDDKCQASCVDWYGNARPIFLGNRTFALMGYEIVEGTLQAGQMREVRRVDYAPGSTHRARDGKADPSAPWN